MVDGRYQANRAKPAENRPPKPTDAEDATDPRTPAAKEAVHELQKPTSSLASNRRRRLQSAGRCSPRKAQGARGRSCPRWIDMTGCEPHWPGAVWSGCRSSDGAPDRGAPNAMLFRSPPNPRRCSLLRDRLADPFLHHVGDLVGVLFQHHHVAVAVNSHCTEIEVGWMHPSLLQVFDQAVAVRGVE
jgi:hypothetical protein